VLAEETLDDTAACLETSRRPFLSLRQRECDSIKKQVVHTLIYGESSSHRGRAGGRNAITK
jgi:hypothetical protein